MEANGHSHGHAKRGWLLPWTWLTAKTKCLRFGMFVRPTLSWAWLIAKSSALNLADCHVQLLWTWRNVKSKCLGFDIFSNPRYLWTWLTIMSKCFGSNMFVRPMLSLDFTDCQVQVSGLTHYQAQKVSGFS